MEHEDRASLARDMESCRSGDIKFDEFIRRTRPAWRTLAAYILRRWSTPAWVAPEDVEQDMILEVWAKLRKYDPSRGVSLSSYLVWNAVNSAKKRVHSARGSYRHRHADAAPSRFERPFSSLPRTDDADEGHFMARIERIFSEPPRQEAFAELSQIVRRAEASGRSVKERAAFRALAIVGGNVGDAASVVYADLDTRLACRLGSEAAAITMVRSARRQMSAVGV